VKCSLLTLSTFIDGELNAERRAEVDAHLVGCPRCGAGAATLREEKTRVARLARVQVDEESAQLMLEQVGIAIPTALSRPQVAPAPTRAEPPRPAAGGAPAAAWAPSFSPSSSDTIEELPVAAELNDSQPDLFEAAPPAVGSPQTAVQPGYAVAAATQPGAADDEWAEVDTPAPSWEADLPAPADDLAGAGEAWTMPAASAAEPPPAVFAPPPAVPSAPIPAPMRVPAGAGASGLLSRMRDAMAVRAALARRGEALDDSVQILNGAQTRRAAAPPAAPSPPMRADVPAIVPAASQSVAAAAEPQPSIELQGTRGTGLASHATRETQGSAAAVEHRPLEHGAGAPSQGGRGSSQVPVDPQPERWHAFAASSYPAEQDSQPEPLAPPRRLGRHSRAVARERVRAGTRLAGALGGAATTIRTRAAGAAGVARRPARGLVAAGPDSRIVAGVAGIGLIFVIALLAGHSRAPAHTAAARHPAPTAALSQPQPQPKQSTPVVPPVAVAPTASAAPAIAQTFGSGATGFEVDRLRYGKQATYTRVVFDIAPVGAARSGTPTVTVAFTNPTTVLVTLHGTAPAPSVGTPPSGTVISSVTLVSSGGSRTEYRIVLHHAASATAFFLLSPTRFVLDLH
jgi:Putative zinc-finger